MRNRLVLTLTFLFNILLQNSATSQDYGKQNPGPASLIVKATPPAFLREGDRINFTANIQNKSDSEVTGQVELQLLDPVSNQSVDGWFRNFYPNQYFTAPAHGQVQAGFSIEVPYQYQHALQYNIIIRSGNLTHRDVNQLPVLSSRQLLTECFPLYLQGQSTKNFVFEKLRNSGQQESLQHQSFSIEWSSNPSGFIVQALAGLQTTPAVSSEEIMAKLFAQQAKLVLYQRHSEFLSVNFTNKEKHSATTNDSNQCVHNSDELILQLQEFQNSDGGFSWLKGSGSDAEISIKLLNQLAWMNQSTTLSSNPVFQNLCTKALAYLDAFFLKKIVPFQNNAKTNPAHLVGDFELNYLLLRSRFPENVPSIQLSAALLKITNQMEKNWQQLTPARQAMVALLAYRNQQTAIATSILDALEKQAHTTENESRYWKDATPENQSMMMEVFSTVRNNRKIMMDMGRWLLEQKKGDCWFNASASSAAIRALLLLSQQQVPVKIQTGIQAGKMLISNDDTETGMHYFRKTVEAEQTNPTLGAITVKQTFSKQEISNSLNWGAAYWSYLEPLEKITQAPSPLHLEKKLYRKTIVNGKNVLKPLQEFEAIHPGDTLTIKLFIKTDQSLEYLHLQESMHATLKTNQNTTGMQWQGKLGYYCAPSDNTLHYYFKQIPKGNFTIQYQASATHSGEFSSGISSIECTYQPAIVSYTQSGQISVESQTP